MGHHEVRIEPRVDRDRAERRLRERAEEPATGAARARAKPRRPLRADGHASMTSDRQRSLTMRFPNSMYAW